MAARFGLAATMTLLLASFAGAQTQVIVQDNFDQYANTAAFLQQWVPTIGNGSALLPESDPSYLAGVLTSDPFSNPANFPGVQGQAVDHVGSLPTPSTMVNQRGGAINQGAAMNPAFTINPSETQDVFLSADIFVGTSGNERMSVGLRHVAVAGTTVTTTNLLEMGQWNAATTDPTLPATPAPPALPATNYAARINLFGAPAAPLVRQPDWQYFVLPVELDRETDTDEVTSLADVGAGWHTYTATISLDKVTLTIDLFRDGLRNTSNVPDEITGIRPGTAGVDGTFEYEIPALASGFNSLRIGGPSGLSSAGTGPMGFDNILLQLQAAVVDPSGDNADFDGDGDVDGADFLTFQRGNGAAGDRADGDANGDNLVNADDLAVFQTQFGTAGGAAPAIAGVPEPTTIALAAMAMFGALAAARRR